MELTRLYFDSVAELRRAGHFAMITLVDYKREWQISVITDSRSREQLALRMHRDRYNRERLPEVMAAMLRDVADTDDCRVVITAVVEGEYIADVVFHNIGYKIRLSDAVLLSEVMDIPIYITESLMRRQRTPYDERNVGRASLPINIMPSEVLRDNLRKAVDMEDYEMARIISNELKSRHDNSRDNGEKEP